MDGFTQFDGNLLIGIQHALNADWLTPIMKIITYFGEAGIFWIAVCLLLLCFRKTRRLGIICSLSLLLSFILCNLALKPLIDRTRPWVTFEEVTAFLPPPGDSSFPSGHSANSMSPAWAMFLATLPGKRTIRNDETGATRTEKDFGLTPCLGWKGVGADPAIMHRWSIAAVILALLIGLSRLYLGMHYPSDVLAGLLLGMLSASIVWLIVRKRETSHGIIGGKSI